MKISTTAPFSFISILLTSLVTLCDQNHVEITQKIATIWGITDQVYELQIDDKVIGRLACSPIPLVNCGILYNFYIEPKYRNQGYGKQLFQTVFDNAIKSKPVRIFIQAGPFEFVNNKYVPLNQQEYEKNIKKLV